nr:vp91 capsid [Darna trima granulovirus]
MFYTRFVIEDFNNDTFSTRLNVLKEYLQTIGTVDQSNNHIVPSVLGYVSHVDRYQTYAVTYFDTNSLKDVGVEFYDKSKTKFDFTKQKFDIPTFADNPDAASVSHYALDVSKFVAHVDDGEVLMECNNGIFNGSECVEKPICDRSDIKLPLTEDRLNALIFNKNTFKKKPTTDHQEIYHPTAYVQCDSQKVPRIEECLNGEQFQVNKCVYNPPVVSNGMGLVTYVDTNKTGALRYVKNIVKHRKRFVKTYKSLTNNVAPINNNLSNTTPNINKNIISCKKLLYKYNTVNVVDTDKFKHNNSNKTNSDRIMIFPVNCSYPFDASPCNKHGAGHTFTSNKIASNQYFECLDNYNLFLHSCKNINFVNNKHVCDYNLDCDKFDNGTGDTVNTIDNDKISFATGKSVCLDYRIVDVVECDTGDFVTDKQFNHPLHVSFDIALPKQIFDTTTNVCVDYDVDRIVINDDSFEVKVDEINKVSRNMVGRISKILNKNQFITEDKISTFVTYSRDVGEVCFEPGTVNVAECLKDVVDDVVFDIFDNSKYNLCNNGYLIEEVDLNNDEFLDEHGKLQRLENYSGQCRFDEGQNYFDVPYRTVDQYECYYTIPKTF